MRKERKKVQGKGGIPILRRLVSLTLCLAMLTTMVPSLPWSRVETARAAGEAPQAEGALPDISDEAFAVASNIAATPAGTTDTITIGGIRFYVLKHYEDEGKALIFAADDVTKMAFDNPRPYPEEYYWHKSTLRSYLNNEWLDLNPILGELAIESEINTALVKQEGVGPESGMHHIFYKDSVKVFLLSAADVYGTSAAGSKIEAELTAGEILFDSMYDSRLLPNGENYGKYWLRTTSGGTARQTAFTLYKHSNGLRVELYQAVQDVWAVRPVLFVRTIPPYDIIYDKNSEDAVVTAGSKTKDEGIKYQDDVVTPSEGCTRPGYKLVGWNTEKNGSGTGCAKGETISGLSKNGGEVTLYAQWEPMTYNIVFNKNDSAAQGEMAPQTMTYGEASVLNENQFTLANKVFGGWNLDPDGRGTSFDDEEDINARGVITPLSEGMEYTLYAQWNAIQYHKVHFYPNGGTFNGKKDPTLYRTTTTDLNSRNYVEYPDKSKFAALDEAPTRPGYTFMGWYDEITGGNKIYDEECSLNVSGRDLEIDNDTALFAQWTADSMTIGDIEDQTYDGTQKQPALEVRVSGNLLTAGTDYITIWENNINASGTHSNPGKAVAKVYGINDYAGINQTKEFNILKADQVITFAPVDGGSADISYGESFENTASAKYDSQNVAITYSLVGDGDSDEAQLDTATGKVTPLKGGVSITVQAASAATDNVNGATKEYTLNIAKAVPELYFANEEISAKGGETITNTLTINAKNAADSSALMGNVKYTIKSQTPDGVVASGGISGDGTETVSINAGTVLGDAVIKASLEENDKYEVASVEFTLHMVSESDIQYRAKGYSGTYDGQGHQITITPVNPADGSLKVYYSTEDIEAGDNGWSEIHPEITEVSEMSENGSKEVYFKLEAAGYRTVTGSARVEIRPAELTEASFQLSEGEERTAYAYTGEGVEPVIEQVKAGNLIALKDDTHQDYDVTYHNNVEVTGENSKAYAKITGKGNYTGTIMKAFDILPNLWIMLDLNDGTGSSPVKVEGVAGEAVPYTAPQRDGYMFAGWSRESGTEAAGDMNPKFTDELNQKTLYAVWKKQADKELYTVTFVIDETIEEFAPAPSYTFLTANEEGKLGSQVLPQVKRIGENADRYQFVGWLTPDGRRVGPDTVFTENTEVKPSWQYTDPDKKDPPYTITFDGNDGTVIGDITVKTDDMGKLSQSKFSKAERENYTFDGWFTASSGGISTDSATKFYEDTTLYAHWTYNGEDPSEGKKPPFDITFNANGGTLTAGDEAAEPQETMTVATDSSGKLSKLPELVSADGKAFDGWYTGINDGYNISVDTIFHENTVVYARWFDVHNVTFNPNGGTFADLTGYTEEDGMVKIATDSSGKLTEAMPEVSRRGYIFVGWFTDKNGSIDRNTLFAEDMTVRAVWDTDPDADKKFAVTFDANGGKLSGTGTLITDKNGTLTGQQLPEATRANHNFEGWYYDGNPVTESTVFTADSVVYAKWTGTGGGGGGGVLDVQRPIIEAGEGVTVSLNPDGTVASITVKEGYELDDVILNGASKGKVTTVSGLKTGDRLTVNGRKIGEQTSGSTGGIGLMSRYKLIARSSYAVSPKGKQAILIKWRDRNGLELNFDGVEIFRSTKRFSGFGKKPIFDTSLGRYYNTDIEGGVKYYYKVRGYIKIGGVKYYTDWSLKAFRVAKTKSTK